MAETVRKFSVDVNAAAKAIDKLNEAAGKYNERIKEQRRLTDAYNKQADKIVERLKEVASTQSEYNRSLGTSIRAIGRHNTALENNADRVRMLGGEFKSLKSDVQDFSKGMLSAADGLYNIRGAAAGANRALGIFEAQVGKVHASTRALQTSTGNIAFSIDKHKALLNADSRALSDNVASVLRFGRAIDQVVGGMKTKNGVLEAQVKAVKQDKEATDGLHLSYTRLFVVQLLHRIFYDFIRAIKDAYEETRLLSIAIAELQTIQGNSLKTSAEWRDELLRLSSAFGRGNLEIAAGAYEALSNQIVTAANSSRFLTAELQLALTTQSTLKEAVNATSSVMNAFGFSTASAAEINAKLFKTVELGRIRLEELGSQFGRVNVLSATLGVTFDEQQAALTVLTRKGLAAHQAQILLVNVINSLIKPSKEMQEVLAQWGVNSGGAAVQTFGFVGVLRKLAIQAASSGDRLSEISEAFKDLRALTGAAALTQAFDEFEADLGKIKESTVDFNKAIGIATTSMGQKVSVELQKLKNQFITTFGDPTLKLFVGFSNVVGGLDNALRVALVTGGLYLTYIVSSIAYTKIARLATVDYATAMFTLGHNTTLASKNSKFFQIGISALVTVLIAAAFQANQYATNVLTAAKAQTELGREFRANILTVQLAGLNAQFEFLNATVTETFKNILGLYSELSKANRSLVDDFDDNFNKIAKTLLKSADRPLDALTTRLREFEAQIDKQAKQAERFQENINKARQETRDKAFDNAVANEVPLEQVRLLEVEKRRLHAESLELLKRGEEELADVQNERIDKIDEKQRKLLEKLKKEATERKLAFDVPVPQTDAFGNPKFDKKGNPLFKRKRGRVASPDEEQETALLQRLNQLEADRAAIVEQRLQAQQDFIDAQKEEAANAKAVIDKQQENIRTLRDILAEIDSFKPDQKGAPEKFNVLVGKAEEVLKDTGLDEEAKLNILRQAYALRAELRKKALNDATQAEITAQQDALLQAKTQQEKILAQEKKALDERAELLAAFLENSKSKLDALRAIFTENQPVGGLLGVAGLDETKGGVGFADKNAGNNAADQQRLVELAELLRQQQILTDTLRTQAAQQPAIFDEEKLNKARANLEAIVALVRKIDPREIAAFAPNELNQSFGGIWDFIVNQVTNTGFGLGFNQGEFNKGGKLALPGDQPVEDTIKALTIEFDNLAAAQQRVAKAQAELGAIGNNLEGQRQQVEQLKNQFPDLAAAMNEAAKQQIGNQQNVNQLLAEQEERISRIINLIRQQQALQPTPLKQAFGGPVHLAFGGSRGIDRIPALLAGGETVMTQLASRQFGPFLNAANHSPPTFRSHGGSVSFGDINITTSGGTSRAQAIEIAGHLQKLVRQGRY